MGFIKIFIISNDSIKINTNFKIIIQTNAFEKYNNIMSSDVKHYIFRCAGVCY